MAINFLGPLMFILMIASVIGIIVGFVMKKKNVIRAFSILLIIILLAYAVMSMFFE